MIAFLAVAGGQIPGIELGKPQFTGPYNSGLEKGGEVFGSLRHEYVRCVAGEQRVRLVILFALDRDTSP